MTRHGKNQNASSVYSYTERQKDAKQSGYGTLHERLGADSMKPYDCCSLTLQPCREPLISPDGYIFDKEAILTYIVQQKKEFKRKMKLWEEQCKREAEKEEQQAKVKEEELKKKFVAFETASPTVAHELPTTSKLAGTKRKHGGINEEEIGAKRRETSEDISNMTGAKAREWKSFWVPELSTTVSNKLEKPSEKILCPISGKALKFKDLLPVKFTPIDDDPVKNAVRKDRYMCPVTRSVLTNSSRCAYLKTSQFIVSMACVEKIIKKEMIDPLNGQAMKEEDIIELKRGGTGFAATNQVEAKLVRPQMELT
uniref:Nitric oxide synthase-interacting protein homolog n=2 Tax=Acrobeloides nanus TaxID=290746 RepID=A0A914EF42_9BILA